MHNAAAGKKRKEKGGAEKAREKKLRNLDAEATKCRKLTEIFSSTASSSTSQFKISSSEEVSQTATQQHATSDDEGQKDELVPQADTGQMPIISLAGIQVPPYSACDTGSL
ncbi:unnamed protein product [Lota lota]